MIFGDQRGDIERSRADEWTAMQAALAFGGFIDAAETERVTLWAAEEIESLRQQLQGAVDLLRQARGYVADHATAHPADETAARLWQQIDSAINRAWGR